MLPPYPQVAPQLLWVVCPIDALEARDSDIATRDGVSFVTEMRPEPGLLDCLLSLYRQSTGRGLLSGLSCPNTHRRILMQPTHWLHLLLAAYACGASGSQLEASQ